MSSGNDGRRSIGSRNAAECGWLDLWADAWETPMAGLWRQAMAAQSGVVLAWWKAFGGGVPGALAYTLRGVPLQELRQSAAAWAANPGVGQAGCIGAADLRAALGLPAGHGSVLGTPVPADNGAVAAASEAGPSPVHRGQHAAAPMPARAGKRKPVGRAAAPAVPKVASGTVARGAIRIKRPVVR